MSPIWVSTPAVPAANVRRLTAEDAYEVVPVQQLALPVVPAPSVVPRQIDPVGLRLMALQLENDDLKAELQQLRSA
jgi:hypothetical protein